MEWVETTAKTVDDAKSAALDRLGVAADEAEFDVVEEPKPGLFGRTRGEARVRARVKPATVRPKNDRRRKSSRDRAAGKDARADRTPKESVTTPDVAPAATSDTSDTPAADPTPDTSSTEATVVSTGTSATSGDETGRADGRRNRDRNENQEQNMNGDSETVSPHEVGDAAVSFMDGLVDAFGAEGSTELTIEGIELDVAVTGSELGLLVGPSGRTLNAIQDLARVAAQRRLGDHETRLRIDVAGYRARRSDALSRFARDVAGQVRESGVARSLEAMSSADRKVVHDALNEEDGVSSRSEGDDPNRRVVVVPG